MRIATIGRGTIGGTLARLWGTAGHEVTTLGRDGGSVTDAEVILVAVPYGAVPDALDQISGFGTGQVVLDATNRLRGERPPEPHASNAELIAERTGSPVAKVFNLNFGGLLERAADASPPNQALWVGDDAAQASVEQLTRDIGLEPVRAGDLQQAETQEAFATMLMGMVSSRGEGLLAYRFAAPRA